MTDNVIMTNLARAQGAVRGQIAQHMQYEPSRKVISMEWNVWKRSMDSLLGYKQDLDWFETVIKNEFK